MAKVSILALSAVGLVGTGVVGATGARRDRGGALNAVASLLAALAVGRFDFVLERALFALRAVAALRKGRLALVGTEA